MQAIGEMTRDQPRARAGRRGWLWAGGTLLAGAVLMFCYLRVAGTTEVTSDGAGLVLQASDMLHGNLLLHDWWDTDVSFLTTELPEYMVVTAVAGIRPEVVHISAALTYTLLVLLAAFVARGRARGAEGVVRALLAAGVMLAPQPTGPTPVLLGSPDHVGTGVPVLLLLLLLDRAPVQRPWARWCVPVGVAMLLAWSIVGDPLVEVVGVIPLVLACLLRVGRIVVARIGGRRVAGAWRAVGYDLSLAAAALLAVWLAGVANSLIRNHGGYYLGPALYGRKSWSMIVASAPMVWRSVLALFGADYSGVTGAGNVAFASAHLAGVAVVIAGVALGVWRLVRPPRGAASGDLVADVLVLAVAANIAAYFAYVQATSIWTAHEIGPVLSLGAALAGRMLGGPLLRARLAMPQPRFLPMLRLPKRPPRSPRHRRQRVRRGSPIPVSILAAWLASCAALLAVAATSAQAPPANAGLAVWLGQHQLRSGLAPYWQASSVTVNSGGAITLLATGAHGHDARALAPDYWESDLGLADPRTHSANFIVITPNQLIPAKLLVPTFGKPARTYRYQSYVILVWNKNLLRRFWSDQLLRELRLAAPALGGRPGKDVPRALVMQ